METPACRELRVVADVRMAGRCACPNPVPAVHAPQSTPAIHAPQSLPRNSCPAIPVHMQRGMSRIDAAGARPCDAARLQGVPSRQMRPRRARDAGSPRSRQSTGRHDDGRRTWSHRPRHADRGMTEKKKTSQHRPRPGGGRFHASTEREVGIPVPAGLGSCSGVRPRGWLRCERPAPSPPRRRGRAAPSLDAKYSSLAPSCHCAPALPGLFFCAGGARVAHRDVATQQKRRFATEPSLRWMRPRAHCRVHARIFSTACSLRRDAACPLLTCLVRSVYVPEGRGVAFGRGTDIQRNTAIPSHLPDARRPTDGAVGVLRIDRRDPAGALHRGQEATDGGTHACLWRL
jgi:hypothetical protein